MATDLDEHPAEPITLQRFELQSLWRVLLWGASAAMAVAIVAGTAFSDLGAERLKQTLASLTGPGQQTTAEPLQTTSSQAAPPQVTPQQLAALEQRTHQLAQTVRELVAERDSVKAKLASVEQNLDDITGAIRRQTAQAGAFAAQLAAQMAAQNAATKQAAATTPPPVVSPPQTVAAVPSPSATTAAPPPETPVTTASTPPAAEASPPLEGPIPLPPTRIAALEPAAAAITRELGVDLGGAASLEALRAYWSGLKANIGPDVVGLMPSFTVRQRQIGGTDYRLILGPLPNSAAALRLCARLATSGAYCRPGTFTVQRLADATPVAPAR